MAKGSYEIYKPQGANANDSTWKSFTCTLLIFLIICLIILLVSWPWKSHHGSSEGDITTTDKLYKENDTDKVLSAHPTDEKFSKIVHTTTTRTALENSDGDDRDKEHHGHHQRPDEDEETTTHIDENVETEIVRVLKFSNEKNSKIIQSTTLPPDVTTERTHHKYHWSDKHAVEKTDPETTTEDDGSGFETSTDIVDSSGYPVRPSKSENKDSDSTTTSNQNWHKYTHKLIKNEDDQNYETSSLDNTSSDTYTATEQTTPTEEIKLTNENKNTYDSSSRKSIISNDHIFTTTEKTSHIYLDGIYENHTAIECEIPLKEKETCNNTGCKVISSKMLSLMNGEVDPCNDFYKHTCDGINQPYLAEDDLSLDVSKRIIRSLNKQPKGEGYINQFRKFLTSCESYDYTKVNDSVRNIIDSVGKFYGKTDTDQIPSISFLLTEMLNNNFPALFDITVNVDKISGRLGLVVMPFLHKSSLKYVFAENYYDKTCFESTESHKGPYDLNTAFENYKTCEANKTLYLDTVKESLEALGVFSDSNLDEDIQEIMLSLEILIDLIKEVRTIHDVGKNKLSSPSRLMNSVLCRRIPQINWTDIFNNITGIELTEKTYIQIYHADYLDELIRCLVERIKPRELNNALMAMYAHQIHRDYVLDQKINCDRKPYCLTLSNKLMEDVSSSLYLDSFKMTSINEFDIRSSEIFTDLKKTLTTEIVNFLADTTDEKTALEKLNTLNLINIGKYMPWRDRKFITNRFDGVTLDEETFVENAHQLQLRYRKHMYSTYGNDPKLPENIWTIFSLPYDTKIKTVQELDLIVLPLGATSRNTFPKDIPRYLLMSDFGLKLAQELIIYLQSYGIKILDPTYNQNTHIPIRVNTMIDGEQETFKVDLRSDHFLKERLPNIAGANLAYLTYKRFAENSSTDLPLVWTDKSIYELFFINMAQQFCTKSNLFDGRVSLFEETKFPGIMKVNSIAINLDKFSEVFNCSAINEMPAGIKLPQNVVSDYEYPYNPNDSK